jgi:NADPH:quinone reductase-like Zn-dependent oxidoreductase
MDMEALASVPAGVGLAEAAALPVAGLAALQALRAAGLRSGKRVLVTGASGGVGRFAVQLAADAGAHVVAAVGSTSKREGLRVLGAAEVIVSLDDIAEPVDIVLDNVGGATLVAAWDLLGQPQTAVTTTSEPAPQVPVPGTNATRDTPPATSGIRQSHVGGPRAQPMSGARGHQPSLEGARRPDA